MSINNKLVTRLGILLASILAGSSFTHAETTHHRLVWDSNPSTSAVIGFSPSDSSDTPYVSYGYSTDESQWATQAVTSTQTFADSLKSYFVRLTGLNADSAVYYSVCDQSGCGQRFWFRTAPTDNSPYVVVAGGDTRSGWSTRRAGNTLISKIRPLFIMHGGDFTNANNAYEMNQYLTDWALTYSSDTIDGHSYKRIYPLIPTHGNHEDNNFETLCQVFGVDYNQDNECSNDDTYAAFNISPLLRVYTLNSQFQSSGWSAQASTMNLWLDNDLSSSGSSATWRFAQYHKPMFPHSTQKSDNTTLYYWWADLFFENAMNVVMESDTHIAKVTKALLPSGNDFAATTSGGTVYMGEGSWGAPARSADDAKSWTIDLASIQQFKVITVSADNLEMRTAQFNDSASTLTLDQRASDATLLPSGVNWWNANDIGEVMTLVQSAESRSIIHHGSADSGGSSDSFNVSADTFISRAQSDINFDGSAEQLLADGSDVTYGQMMSLIKFDLSSVASCVDVTSATITLDVFDSSTGTYGVYESAGPWSASSATWNSVAGDLVKGTQLAVFNPSSTGVNSIVLDSAGVNLIEGWIQGSNTGIVIATEDATDGIDVRDMESGNGAKLELVLDESGCELPTQLASVSLPEVADTTISSIQENTNLNSVLSGIEADGWDSLYGEMIALIKFSVTSDVPSCAAVTEVKLTLNIDDLSYGHYQVFAATSSWTADGATWNNVGGASVKGTFMGDFMPSSLGTHVYDLDPTANAVVENWAAGGVNNGIVIASGGTTDGVIITDDGSENAKLQVTYDSSNCP